MDSFSPTFCLPAAFVQKSLFNALVTIGESITNWVLAFCWENNKNTDHKQGDLPPHIIMDRLAFWTSGIADEENTQRWMHKVAEHLSEERATFVLTFLPWASAGFYSGGPSLHRVQTTGGLPHPQAKRARWQLTDPRPWRLKPPEPSPFTSPPFLKENARPSTHKNISKTFSKEAKPTKQKKVAFLREFAA